MDPLQEKISILDLENSLAFYDLDSEKKIETGKHFTNVSSFKWSKDKPEFCAFIQRESLVIMKDFETVKTV